MPKLIPLGYATPHSTGHLEALMQDERTVLVDVRLMPFSRRYPNWSKLALQSKWRSRYLWLGESLGNVNYNDDLPIQLANPGPGIARMVTGLQHGYNQIVLCACKQFRNPDGSPHCHRAVVVDEVLKVMPGVEVVLPETIVPASAMMCLSFRQPYASWLVHPQRFIEAGITPKVIENRDWSTSFRGKLLIHASGTFEDGALDAWLMRFPNLGDAVPLEERSYPRKAIVGIVELVDVVTESDDSWFCGDYGFVLRNARPFEAPIPYRGQLKLFSVPLSLVQEQLLEGANHL